MKYSSGNKLLIAVFLLILIVFLEYIFYIKSNRASIFQERNAGWEKYVDTRIRFDYPHNLSTFYITEVDWPPQVNILEGKLECNEAGEILSRAGLTEKRNIRGTEYCVTRIAEGAAGSTYLQFAYAREVENKVPILTFSLKYTQCSNYSGFQKEDCEEERIKFDIDNIIDRIFRSMDVL